MKNRKNFVYVLAVMILMVSTVALFTGCDHIYKQKLVGVWEVKKVSADGLSMEFPMDIIGVKTYSYVYFTADGKFGMATKIEGNPISSMNGLFKNNLEEEYTIKGSKITVKKGNTEEVGTFELKGTNLILKTKNDGKEASIEAVKTASPSLDDIKNAKKLTTPSM